MRPGTNETEAVEQCVSRLMQAHSIAYRMDMTPEALWAFFKLSSHVLANASLYLQRCQQSFENQAMMINDPCVCVVSLNGHSYSEAWCTSQDALCVVTIKQYETTEEAWHSATSVKDSSCAYVRSKAVGLSGHCTYDVGSVLAVVKSQSTRAEELNMLL